LNNPAAFVDPTCLKDTRPFGIQNLGGWIYVTYAKQDADREDEIAGPGLGVVDVSNSSGNVPATSRNRRNIERTVGLTLAPTGFGEFGGDLLVGNFGDGRINAFRVTAQGSVHVAWAAARHERRSDRHPTGSGDRLRATALEPRPTTSLFFAAGLTTRRTACSASSSNA